MRSIEASGYPRTPAGDPGAAPMLQWLNIADLVVDDAYQRPIRDSGRANVRRIAEAFRWSCFAPVIVAPVAGGKFAIIDGQHRATAAALCGHEAVPCQVVSVDSAEQARAFKAVNGNVTKMSRMAIHVAAVAAGDPEALALQQACEVAEVELLRYPVPRAEQKAGQTMAVQAAAACLAQYGRETLITALMCVTQTDNNRPGVLGNNVIKALCQVLGERKEWRDAGGDLFEAFDQLDLAEAEVAARERGAREKSVTATVLLADAIRAHLAAALPQCAAAA